MLFFLACEKDCLYRAIRDGSDEQTESYEEGKRVTVYYIICVLCMGFFSFLSGNYDDNHLCIFFC